VNAVHVLDPGALLRRARVIAKGAAAKEAARREAAEMADKILNDGSFQAGREVALRMGEKLEAIGEHELAHAVAGCFATGYVELYENGSKTIPKSNCGGQKKLCPFHARMETRRRLEKYVLPISEAGKVYRLQWGTLTVPNLPRGRLSWGIDGLWAAYKRLRRRHIWQPVTGAIVKMETTWNDSSETWNLHLHVLAAMRHFDGTGETDFSYASILREWSDCADREGLAGSQWHWWKPVSRWQPGGIEKAAKELLKYTSPFYTRPGDGAEPAAYGKGLLQMPDCAFSEWFVAWRGERDLRSYGVWNAQSKVNFMEEIASERDLGELLAYVNFIHNPSERRFEVFSIHNHKSTSELPISQEITRSDAQLRLEYPP